MFQLFMEGAPGVMAILTILFVALFFAAWKAPRWVKEIGLLALAYSIFSELLGLRVAFDAIQTAGGMPMPVFIGGLKVMLVPLIYAVIIYMVSLIIRIIQKPRL